MKNADKPINPTLELDYTESIIQGRNVFFNQEFGLTKREYFAGLAMQGLISSFTEKASYGGWGTEMKETIKCAIDYADELLKQLEDICSNTKE